MGPSDELHDPEVNTANLADPPSEGANTAVIVRPDPNPGPGSVISDEELAAVFNQWTRDHIHNSPVAKNTPAFNHLMSKLGDLRKAILAKFG